ncbi:hypothetical protein ACX3YG_13735 [Pseudomonas wadenswilerensis]
MKQENRFVAQLFHYLAPFVDLSEDLFICVDGGAAKHHAGQDGAALLDQNVPDLWFTLIGKGRPTGIEAKIIEKNSMSFRRGQVQAWRTNGGGRYQPELWVATNRDLSEFYCWHHTDIQRRLDDSTSNVDNIKLSLTNYPPAYRGPNLAGLALFVLTHSKPDPYQSQ